MLLFLKRTKHRSKEERILSDGFIHLHPLTTKVRIVATAIKEYPHNVSKVILKRAVDINGDLWTNLGTTPSVKMSHGVLRSASAIQDVFSPSLNPYNIWIALQERTFRSLGVKPNLNGCEILHKSVSMIKKCWEGVTLPEFSIEDWITLHREPSGKTIDRGIYDRYCKWLEGDWNCYEEAFSQYTWHNDKPKKVTTRFKLHEKFTSDDIKPRLYDVFDGIHAVIYGPIYHALGKLAPVVVPGYCDGVSLPELKDKINLSLDCIESEHHYMIDDLGFTTGDGSKFDSTQYIEIMEVFRTPIVKLLIHKIYSQYED